ncbi:MAG: hypothetical protein HXY43_19440 [Fischerella sp.]|jgi:hypothetical protein|uniref:hypothetical protein n=1 Tax=unclassified Fischerella TaxID=494603 RepID=UPI00047DD5A8|nr:MULTISPECIES: hypothetical protein [unclassified Fischerella]NWF61359.1 hypothetical protein [Fischerella sp.]
MTQHILCQTPTKGWMNLAYARQIRFRKVHLNMSLQEACVITWSNGDKESFFGKDAQIIAQTWKNYTKN